MHHNMQQKELKLTQSTYSVMVAQCLVVIWCAWESQELLQLYQLDSPYDNYAGVFFLIWMIPFCVHWMKSLSTQRTGITNIRLSILGIFCALFGRIISFEFPGQIGLAMALGGLLPPSRKSICWVIGACCWIHPFKWFVVQSLGAQCVTPVRLAFLGFSMLIFIGKNEDDE